MPHQSIYTHRQPIYAPQFRVIDSEFNRARFPRLIGMVFESRPGSAQCELVEHTMEQYHE